MNIKRSDKLKLWLFCGFELNRLQYTDGDYQYNLDAHLWKALPISLDTLYQFAIPKLQKEGYGVELATRFGLADFRATIIPKVIIGNFENLINEFANTPTEALYNAIMKVIENEVKREIPKK
jgi:hypothetical protein